MNSQEANRKILSMIFSVIILTTTSLASCSMPRFSTGPSRPVDKLETILKRGESTKEDVRLLFGAPNGYGEAELPSDTKPREVWCYKDVDQSSSGNAQVVNTHRQTLLLFFDKEVLDGYLWFATDSSLRQLPQ